MHFDLILSLDILANIFNSVYLIGIMCYEICVFNFYSQKIIKEMAEPRSNVDCGDCGLSTLAKVVRMVKLRETADRHAQGNSRGARS